MKRKQVLAADFGGSSGRVMMAGFDGGKINIQEIHRFSNDPVVLEDTLYWDFLRLFFEVKQGLIKAKSCGDISSIGIDTWGVDFGLLDKKGRLMTNPVHYRDGRTAGYLEKSFQRIDRKQFYEITGNQFMEINTAFQLMALNEDSPEQLKQAEHLLLMPDLFRYYLSGEKTSERSIASTTQLFDMNRQTWGWPVIEKLGIPEKLFGSLVSPGTEAGMLRPALAQELGIHPMSVTAVAGHDTQSALAAVPADGEDFIFISCGTWSLVGTELKTPIMDANAERFNLTNELGVEGTYSFLKNIIGLWLIQESRRQWIREGQEYGFGQLEEMAGQASPDTSFIDPDAPEFVPAGDIPGRIRQFCQRTGQSVPETVGDIVRCINRSLALTYKKTLEELELCTGKHYPVIHIVGGGSQSRMLCRMTADACGRTVVAGPVEATGLGNAMIQYMAGGEFANLKQAREALKNSVEPQIYEPKTTEAWEEAYGQYRRILDLN